MSPLLIVALVSLVLIALILAAPYWVEYKRNKVKARPFPKAWRRILKSRVPLFHKLPADLQLQLKRHILVFLAEKRFHGFQGIEINDEIKVTIAAQACLLILNRKARYYPKLKSIYVYPAAFIASHQGTDAAGVLQNQSRVLSGESWELGKVIVSWKDTVFGADNTDDGHNVVIHEFAHQLDQETGIANGAPFLSHKKNRCWSNILTEEFKNLQLQAANGEQSLLDHYGATNPAEFFAVASEVFFERPIELKRRHAALYQQLESFYRVDPAEWHPV